MMSDAKEGMKEGRLAHYEHFEGMKRNEIK